MLSRKTIKLHYPCASTHHMWPPSVLHRRVRQGCAYDKERERGTRWEEKWLAPFRDGAVVMVGEEEGKMRFGKKHVW